MYTLTVTVGLPGSGKTTAARTRVAADPEHWIRVNRDDLRIMGHGARLGTTTQEDTITVLQHAAVAALLEGHNVVVDDTNLRPATMDAWKRIADAAGAHLDVWDFTHVPIDVCHTRNEKRTGPARVPRDVIDTMWTTYTTTTGRAG
jgi:predicted kinase